MRIFRFFRLRSSKLTQIFVFFFIFYLKITLVLVPCRKKKGLKNEVSPCVLLAVSLSVRPSFRPAVRSLPRYLRIALIDFDEIFRKVQSYAKLERDIFGFLKKCFFVRILGKKGQNMSKKIQKTFFSTKFYFLPIFENMNVEG